MASLPCYCPICSSIYPCNNFRVSGNVINSTFKNCLETCPNCGLLAKVVDGTYNFYDDVIQVVEGTPFTYYAATQIQKIAKDAIQNKTSIDEAIDALCIVAPTIGNVVKELNKSNPSKGAYLLFFAFLAYLFNPLITDLAKPTTTRLGEVIADKIIPEDSDKSSQ